ncbi:MAG: hypothetical protein ACE14M_01495 [Terriglobales bacterium]
MPPAVSEKKPALPPANREVIVRASIDNEGRGHSFQVLRGDQKLVPLAMDAARHWRFQPCSGASCEQLLKFTDYGGATSMHLLNGCPASAEDCFAVSARTAE